MDKLEESFDGSFSDNIRSAAYKNQFTSKKHKMVINVACIPTLTQKLSTQWSSTWLRRTDGTCRPTRSNLWTLTSVGLTITWSRNCSHGCRATRRSTTSLVTLAACRNGHPLPQKQSRHVSHELQETVPIRIRLFPHHLEPPQRLHRTFCLSRLQTAGQSPNFHRQTRSQLPRPRNLHDPQYLEYICLT